jgi:hypothetical protein
LCVRKPERVSRRSGRPALYRQSLKSIPLRLLPVPYRYVWIEWKCEHVATISMGWYPTEIAFDCVVKALLRKQVASTSASDINEISTQSTLADHQTTSARNEPLPPPSKTFNRFPFVPSSIYRPQYFLALRTRFPTTGLVRAER